MIRRQLLDKLGVTALTNAIYKKSKENGGYLRGLDGRRIPIRRKSVGLNYLIACGSAVVGKVWMVDLDEQTQHLDSHLVIRAHDEGQFEVRQEDAEAFTEIALRTALEAGEKLGLRLPTPADAATGANWSQTH